MNGARDRVTYQRLVTRSRYGACSVRRRYLAVTSKGWSGYGRSKCGRAPNKTVTLQVWTHLNTEPAQSASQCPEQCQNTHSRQHCRKGRLFFFLWRLRSTEMCIVLTGTALSHNPASTNISKSGRSVLKFRKIPLPNIKGRIPWNVATRVTSHKAATFMVATMTVPNLFFPCVRTINIYRVFHDFRA